MTQFCIACFYWICIFLTIRDCVANEVIPKTTVNIKGITVIPLHFGHIVDYILNSLLCAMPNHLPAQRTACLSVYDGQDVDLVFFVTNEGEHLIHLCRVHALWHRAQAKVPHVPWPTRIQYDDVNRDENQFFVNSCHLRTSELHVHESLLGSLVLLVLACIDIRSARNDTFVSLMPSCLICFDVLCLYNEDRFAYLQF